MSALIQSLEAAEGGSRELDARIAVALDVRPDWLMEQEGRLSTFKGNLVWVDRIFARATAGSPSVECALFTTSLDAALALAERVLPDYEASIAQRKPRRGETCAEWWRASLFKVRTGVVFGSGPHTVSCKAKTPELALCIAILRAKEGDNHAR